MSPALLVGFGAGLLHLALLRLMVSRLTRRGTAAAFPWLCFGGRMFVTCLIFCWWCQPNLPQATLGWWLARCVVVRP